jgi:hypothetical protein
VHTGVRQSNPIHPGAHWHTSGAVQLPPLAHAYTPRVTLAHSTHATWRSFTYPHGCVFPSVFPAYADHGCGGFAVQSYGSLSVYRWYGVVAVSAPRS